MRRRASCAHAAIAWPSVEVEIVDANGVEVPPGAVGEIVISSPVVMKGYWNKPEATAASIHDGWMRTGDAAYRDHDGYIYIYDRVKDMIVTGGENVYPAEVENAIAGHPDVADVAVIGVPDEKWGETVKAIVVAQPGAPDPAGIISRARERIANYKVPPGPSISSTRSAQHHRQNFAAGVAEALLGGAGADGELRGTAPWAHFPIVDQAELTRSATASTAARPVRQAP